MVPYETPEIVTLGDTQALVLAGGCRTWEGGCFCPERWSAGDGSALDESDAV